MNLYIFPEAACNKDGYGIGVDFAYRKMLPNPEDIVVWLTTHGREEMLHVREEDIILRRCKLFSSQSLKNIIRGRNRSEFSIKDLSFLIGKDIDEIHGDDVIFYRALRGLFPDKKLYIRFHNCFSRIGVRNQFLKRKIGWKYKYNIQLMTNLEREIFNDRNVFKIFISDEDRDFYRSTYGIISDSETWQYSPNREMMRASQRPLALSHKLVWLGGVEAHKESSIWWFINDILPLLQSRHSDIEFHLWGKNTLKFNNPNSNIFGHGFYKGEGMPLNNSLYLNPDIIGGGIKLKLMSMMEHGVPFISTPFGFEGYEKSLIDNKYCSVIEENEWVSAITNILERYSIYDNQK